MSLLLEISTPSPKPRPAFPVLKGMSRWQRNVLLLGAGGAILFGVALPSFLHGEPEARRLGVALALGLAVGTLCGVSRIVSAFVAVLALGPLGLCACFTLLVTIFEKSFDGRLLAMPAALSLLGIFGVVLDGTETPPRRGSVLASATRRDLLTRVVVGVVAVGGMTALFGDRLWAVGSLGVATLVLGILMAIEVGALQRIGSWLSSAQAATNTEHGGGETIDLGVGHEIRQLGPEALHPYRGAPPGKPRPLRLIGDPTAAVRELRSRTTMRALAMAVGAVALGMTLAGPDSVLTPKVAQAARRFHPPLPRWNAPQKPALLDVDRDGTEDVIGVHRVEVRSPDGSVDAYFLAATSGVTYETLWSTKPTPDKPGAVVACGGHLYLTSDDRTVIIIASQSGTPIRTLEPGEVRDLPGSPSCPLGDVCVDGDTRSCTPSPSAFAFPAEATFGRAPLLRRHRDDAIALGSGRPEVAVGDSVDDYLMGFDPATFKIRWRERVAAPDAGGAGPHHHDVAFGRVFSYLQGSNGQLVVARDAKTGRELWTRRIPNEEGGSGFNGFVASPTRIYVLGQERVEVLEASSGEWIGTVK